ncbi:chemotaxis protein CheY [Steroidobacter denitrificans]|uniref:Chemotaxis protein CheY n=1 Tax=Steroidobacter denitrificans TaxID=465721 RepID=A0A127FC88_STEDE|nr:response regulator transcription factor [Steroidobacter denitrificans]AMN48006.1 chemotaxis protein CheY [Steroidobacter denitrificans]
MGKRILLIEDNADLVANLFGYLEPRGFELDVARDGRAGLRLALNGGYDAIVLDWMLPKMDGLALLGTLRDGGSMLPVLMLTARDQLESKLTGFRAGADDYLTKPFALAELEVRLQALLVRAQGRQQILQVGDLQLNVATREIWRGAVQLHLYTAITNLLEVLMKASPSLVQRHELGLAIWGDNAPDRDVLRAHIYELRKRVDGPFPVKLLQTIPKVGYRIAAPEQRNS